MKKLFVLFSILLSNLIFAQGEFITRWQLPAGQTSITFNMLYKITNSVNYSWTTIPAGQTGSGTLTLTTETITGIPDGATILLSLTPGNIAGFKIANGPDKNLIIDVEQWGTNDWTNMENTFNGCSNLTSISATDTPNVSGVNNFIRMFSGCTNLTNIPGINGWDMSNALLLISMFQGASSFNQSLENWNTGNFVSTMSMFSGASSYDQPLNNWDMSNVVNMSSMFSGATSFNQPLNNWNTISVTNMSGMFSGATSFNQPLNNWNTSSVTNMSGMFSNATSFNQPLNNLNTSSVTNMSRMFSGATAFNQPLNSWNTSNITLMSEMFENANSFDQNLGMWDISNLQNAREFFRGSGISCENYSYALINWNNNINTADSVDFSNNLNVVYGVNAIAARDSLINFKSWIISGDSPSGTNCSGVPSGTSDVKTFELTVFPNPCRGYVFVTTEEKTTLKLYSTTGILLSQYNVYGTIELDLSNLAAGVYFLKSDLGHLKKIVIQ